MSWIRTGSTACELESLIFDSTLRIREEVDMTEAEVTIPKDRPLVAMCRERAFNLLVKSSTRSLDFASFSSNVCMLELVDVLRFYMIYLPFSYSFESLRMHLESN